MSKIESFYFANGEDSGEAIFKAFAAKHAKLFEDGCDALGTENKLEYTAVYNEFCLVFEQHIESKLVIASANCFFRTHRGKRSIRRSIFQCAKTGTGKKPRRNLFLWVGVALSDGLRKLYRYDEIVQERV